MGGIKKGLWDSIPISLGYLSVSFTFGLKAVTDGLTWYQALMISALNLTSAGQFAGLDIITSSGTIIEMICSQLIINIRYSLMSLSLSQKVNDDYSSGKRLISGFGITDEIFATAINQDGKVSFKYICGLIILPWISWTLGTFLGAIAGGLMPNYIRSSLGTAIYGMFLAIIIPPSKKDTSILKVVIISIVISLCFRYLPILNNVSNGFVVVICAIVSSTIGALLFPIKNNNERQSNE